MRQSKEKFEEFLAGRLQLDSLTPMTAAEALLDFYVQVPADDAGGDEDSEDFADLVFFEWGTYDWGNGPTFDYSIRRQFFIDGTDPDEADEGIWALELSFHYEAAIETARLGSGGETCSGPDDVDRFRDLLRSHPATLYVEGAPPMSVDFRLAQPG